MFKSKVLGVFVGILYRLFAISWRYTVYYHGGLKPLPLITNKLDKSIVIGFWHGDELALIGHTRKSPFLIITSDSKDGTMLTTALKFIGNYTVTRGSSTRGGIKALLAFIKKLDRKNYFASFAVDGPKGPIHKAKAGFYSVAKKKNLEVVQLMAECDSKWTFEKSWNKAYLPKPFAKIKIHYFPLPDVNQHSQEEFLEIFNQKISVPQDDKEVIKLALKDH